MHLYMAEGTSSWVPSSEKVEQKVVDLELNSSKECQQLVHSSQDLPNIEKRTKDTLEESMEDTSQLTTYIPSLIIYSKVQEPSYRKSG